MDVIEQLSGSVTILEPRGRIDSDTAKQFGECFSKHLSAGHVQLVIDLHGISYMSSAGFRQLLIAKKSTKEKNGKLAICGIFGELKRLFDVGAFNDLLPVYTTREAGIASVQ